MKTRAKKTDNYFGTLWEVWRGDVSLLTTYHAKAPCTLPAACYASMLVLREETTPDFVFVQIKKHNKVIGFFGVEPTANYLVTFGLHRAYRKPEMKRELWQHIRTFTSATSPLRCIVHEHNTRATRFLEDSGGQLMGTVLHKKQRGSLFEFSS